MASTGLKIVLVTPEIPYNTGAIGRTCLALGIQLILIRPLGFSLSEKAVRRAGMDYWQHVDLLEYDDWDAFMADQQPPHDRMYLFEEHGQETFYAPAYHPEGYLIFGCESKGLPPEVLTGRADRTYRLPMRDARVRSLNLANVATAVAYQALRDSFTG